MPREGVPSGWVTRWTLYKAILGIIHYSPRIGYTMPPTERLYTKSIAEIIERVRQLSRGDCLKVTHVKSICYVFSYVFDASELHSWLYIWRQAGLEGHSIRKREFRCHEGGQMQYPDFLLEFSRVLLYQEGPNYIPAVNPTSIPRRASLKWRYDDLDFYSTVFLVLFGCTWCPFGRRRDQGEDLYTADPK